MTSSLKWILAILTFSIFTVLARGAIITEFNGMVGVLFRHSYLFVWHDRPLPMLQAKAMCKQEGGRLASLKTEELNTFIFDTFFQQDILKTPFEEPNGNFSKWREGPTADHLVSQTYHRNEAWVYALKVTAEAAGEDKWFWEGRTPVTFTNFGNGYTQNDWCCLSVKPAKEEDEYDYSQASGALSNYLLFWYATDCRTYLPYICQYFFQEPNSSFYMDAVVADGAVTCQIVEWNYIGLVALASLMYSIIQRWQFGP